MVDASSAQPSSHEPVDRTGDLDHFIEFIGLRRVAAGRCSILLALQLFAAFEARRLDPSRVVREIEYLEGSRASHTKPATPFTGPHLRGLWHKHFMPNGIPTIARNLRNAIYEYGLPWLEDQVREAQASGEERYLSDEMIRRAVDDAVHGNLERRSNASKLTGEWIVFVPHEGVNHYLAIARHTDGDEGLRKQILNVCCHEFPFLQEVLAP